MTTSPIRVLACLRDHSLTSRLPRVDVAIFGSLRHARCDASLLLTHSSYPHSPRPLFQVLYDTFGDAIVTTLFMPTVPFSVVSPRVSYTQLTLPPVYCIRVRVVPLFSVFCCFVCMPLLIVWPFRRYAVMRLQPAVSTCFWWQMPIWHCRAMTYRRRIRHLVAVTRHDVKCST